MKNKISLSILRTHYKHWSAKSGINQYLEYLDKAKYRISEKLVPEGNDRFPIKNKKIRGKIVARCRKSGNLLYGLNDFIAELSLYRQTYYKRMDIIQYLDPEHSLNLLPFWVNKKHFSFFTKKPKIIAMFHQPTKILKEIFAPQLTRHLHHIILMATEQKDFFLSHFPGEKISVLLHGIDTDYFKPVKLKKPHPGIRCLSVGTWLRDYEQVLNVARMLENNRKFQFHIVSKIDPKNIPGNVVIHKDISDEELLSLYQNSDILFLPLKDATANNVILEGMACGLPIISTDLPATREYSGHAETYLIKENRPESFKDALLHISENKSIYERMSQSSRLRALELSWENVSPKYDRLYRQICKIE